MSAREAFAKQLKVATPINEKFFTNKEYNPTTFLGSTKKVGDKILFAFMIEPNSIIKKMCCLVDHELDIIEKDYVVFVENDSIIPTISAI